MDELWDAILDAVCDFIGIERRQGNGPGLLRWLFRLIFKIFLLLFGILAFSISFLQFRRLRRYRLVSVLLLLALVVVVAAILAGGYIL